MRQNLIIAVLTGSLNGIFVFTPKKFINDSYSVLCVTGVVTEFG